jgi:4-amino-4-deoxy-L-arabinose transferase-like glycosyltransferase
MGARRWLGIALVLLLAAALRFADLASMRAMLHHDEAAYGVDALSLIENPRLQVYFPDNYGREGLWMWLLTPLMAVFGGAALPMRITAALIGVLTAAAAYRMGRELWRSDSAFAMFVAAALAVSFWHALHSHHAFRAISFPLIGTLALAALFHARRTNRGWVTGGVLIGLTFYTYLAARFWMIGMFALLAWWFIRRVHLRRGVLRAALAAGLVCLPLIAALIATPQSRIGQVAVTSVEQFASNLGAWIGVLFADQPIYDNVHYLEGGTLWTFTTAVFAIIGLGALILRQKRAALLIIALAVLSILPAALTDRPITLLRAIGLTIPLALLIGAGLWALWRWSLVGRIAAVGLIALSAVETRGMLAAYVRDPALITPMEVRLNAGLDALAALDTDAPAYAAPFRADHPILRLRAWTLGAHPLIAFDPAACLRIMPRADYLAITAFTPDLAARLMAWGSLETISGDGYVIYRFQRDPDRAIGAESVFGGMIAVDFDSALPDAARAGETLVIRALIHRTAPVDAPYTAFVHFYNEDGALRAQSDQPLCAGSDWRDDEALIHDYSLRLPSDLPTGVYTLGFGLYESPVDGRLAGARLRLEDGDTLMLGQIRVEGG